MIWQERQGSTNLPALSPARSGSREALYGTPSPAALRGRRDLVDRLALRRLHGRDRYGRLTVPLTETALYMRGHWLRMPPFMLARHLATKWRARRREARG